MKKISLIIVSRNSEEYIAKSLHSLVNQKSIESEDAEILIIDGLSTDRTKEIAYEILSTRNILYKIIDNPKKILAAGWNLAIKASDAKYVCRIDAHSELPEDYVAKSITFLENSNSDIVGIGGYLINHATTEFGEIVSSFYDCIFGVGNSPFRIKGNGVIESDTAVFAVYRKEIFDNLGYFNESLDRNQDIDFHKRLRKNNLRLMTDYSLPIKYYVRSDLKSFLKKSYNDGYWIIKSKSFYFRHLIPLLFFFYGTSSLVLIFLTNNTWPLIPAFLYLGMDIFFALKCGKSFRKATSLLFLFPAYHFSYGYGSFRALFKW